MKDRPIAVFDSGVGGLTVLRAISELLPQEDLIYFGDTARSPYGPRPVAEVRRFALGVMDQMLSLDAKMLVVACNAMTVAAYDEAKERYDTPIIGVVGPGVRAGATATRNGKVGILGTQVTIESGVYQRALEAAGVPEIYAQVCPAFVERVEAGDTFSAELLAVAREYLAEMIGAKVDTVVLGCTHYPLLRGVLHHVTSGSMVLISSADEVAKDVYSALVAANLLRARTIVGDRRFIVSGSPETFKDVASRFITGIESVEKAAWPQAVGA